MFSSNRFRFLVGASCVGLALAPGARAQTATPTPAPAMATTTASEQATIAATRKPKAGDYLAALAGLALVLSDKRNPSSTPLKSLEADIQFSAISPFPGGGYSVLPSGEFGPGGALAVNIPLAYAPRQFTGAASVNVLQFRRGTSLSGEDGRNGTANLGVGFSLAQRPVWISLSALSESSITEGGDKTFGALVQLVPETSDAPAIALGVQDPINRRERSAFIVATKQLYSRRPLFATLGFGRGRFSGSSVFGGVSYSPANRVGLAAEYDGLQFNVGANYSITPRFSVLAQLNDLGERSDRPAGQLGRRYGFGAAYTF